MNIIINFILIFIVVYLIKEWLAVYVILFLTIVNLISFPFNQKTISFFKKYTLISLLLSPLVFYGHTLDEWIASF